MTRIGVIGASGFIGAHVLGCARAENRDIQAVAGPRVQVEGWTLVPDAARRWERNHRPEFVQLVDALNRFDVVVNAAGMGAPTSNDEQSLYSANAVQPVLLARACRLAGVRRLVHVSTAAVQGRLDPLDETDRHYPFSPYTRSKAEGERNLLDAGADAPPEVIIYRPTSVQGVEREITRRLARFASAAVVPISGKGDQPLPLALVENVASGIVFSAWSPYCGSIVVQPSEAITTRQLLEIFCARRLVSLPPGPVDWVLRGIRVPSTYLPMLSTSVRGLELLFRGQNVAESSLTRCGFVPPVGHDGWKELGSVLSRTRRKGAHARGAMSTPMS